MHNTVWFLGCASCKQTFPNIPAEGKLRAAWVIVVHVFIIVLLRQKKFRIWEKFVRVPAAPKNCTILSSRQSNIRMKRPHHKPTSASENIQNEQIIKVNHHQLKLSGFAAGYIFSGIASVSMESDHKTPEHANFGVSKSVRNFPQKSNAVGVLQSASSHRLEAS